MLKSSELINSKFYYGVVTKIYTDDTADVSLYTKISEYIPGEKYLKGDIVRDSNDNIYKLKETVTLEANDYTFINHPEYFEAYTPVTYATNLSNPEKEFVGVISKCKIRIFNSQSDTVVDNKVVGSHKYLAVGTPVILIKLAGSGDFCIIGFDQKPDNKLAEMVHSYSYTEDLPYENNFVVWTKSPIISQYFTKVFDQDIQLQHSNIDCFRVYDYTLGKYYKENTDYIIDRKNGILRLLSSGTINLGNNIFAFYNYDGGLRYPTFFSINGGSINVIKKKQPFYLSQPDFWLYTVYNAYYNKVLSDNDYRFSGIGSNVYYYHFNHNNNIYDQCNGVTLGSHSIVSLDYNSFGKYLFSTFSSYPIDNTTLEVGEGWLCSICFFIRDNSNNYLYYIKGDLYNDGRLFVASAQIDNNYPATGQFYVQNTAFINSLKIYTFDLSSMLPSWISFNLINNLGVNYVYIGDNCTKVSLFFELIDLYPSMDNGVLSFSGNYYNTTTWTGNAYFGNASLHIENNGATYPYDYRYNNTYNLFGESLREFNDIDTENGWKRFRFGSGKKYGETTNQYDIKYYAGECNFPFSLQKFEEEVVLEDINDPNRLIYEVVLNSIDDNFPSQGEILVNWTNRDITYDSSQLEAHVYNFTKINENTIQLDRGLIQGTYTFSFYYLWYFNEFIEYLTHALLVAGGDTYGLIEVIGTRIYNVFLNNEVISILAFMQSDGLNGYTGSLREYAYHYNNGSIYNIKSAIQNNISSNIFDIIQISYINTGLITNAIAK